MNLSPRRREQPEINITPLIDVVFLMLIFFMVSTTFAERTRLDVTLPETTREAERDAPQGLRLTINAQGRMFLDGRPLANAQIQTIARALQQAVTAGGEDTPRLVIDADAEARHQMGVRALDAAGRAGIRNVGMAATTAGAP